MLVSTTDHLPDGVSVITLFSVIGLTTTIKLTRGLSDIFRESPDSERAKALDNLAQSATGFTDANGNQANAIIGVRVSTTTASFEDGLYMFMTWYGTPAIVDDTSGQ